MPPGLLRASDAGHGDSLCHWVATLQPYWLGQRLSCMAEELTAAFQVPHRFNAALVGALELHKAYWTATEDREESIEAMRRQLPHRRRIG
ncbi:hypothetical protein GCM10010361_75800 [Streptomyces olivaceiscleroticus]|uniref:Uncharacterized protein n=1 Tax=Streptomyces olivaceiscleroticus TaxID=68245 RepID=A0ABN1BJ62_9ACTN